MAIIFRGTKVSHDFDFIRIITEYFMATGHIIIFFTKMRYISYGLPVTEKR